MLASGNCQWGILAKNLRKKKEFLKEIYCSAVRKAAWLAPPNGRWLVKSILPAIVATMYELRDSTKPNQSPSGLRRNLKWKYSHEKGLPTKENCQLKALPTKEAWDERTPQWKMLLFSILSGVQTRAVHPKGELNSLKAPLGYPLIATDRPVGENETIIRNYEDSPTVKEKSTARWAIPSDSKWFWTIPNDSRDSERLLCRENSKSGLPRQPAMCTRQPLLSALCRFNAPICCS